MAGEKIQFGIESPLARGTSVAADTMIVGEASITFKPDHSPIIPEDDIGVKAKGYRVVETSGKLVPNTLSIKRGYFQILPVLFSLMLKGGVTPTEFTVGQGDYVWNFKPSMTDSNTPDSATFEYGDDINGWQNAYVSGERLKISGSVPQDGGDAAVSIEFDFFAAENVNNGLTASLTPPVVHELNSLLANVLWMDAGSTSNSIKAGVLRAFDLEILSNNYPKFNGGSALTFGSTGEGKIKVLLSLTLENGADANDLLGLVGTVAQFGILLEGPAIGSGQNHNFSTIFYGTVMEPVAPSGKEKETSLATFNIEGVYYPAGTNVFKTLQVVTDKATI